MEDEPCLTPRDGEETLAAVLSFLDAHDTAECFGETSSESAAASPPFQASADSDTSPTSSPTDSPKLGADVKKPVEPKSSASGYRPPRVRSDKRQREELLALREESLALQDRLDELKQQVTLVHSNKKRSLDEGEDDRERTYEVRRLRAQAWQAMAETQQRRRHGAEVEREQLRELIDQQKKSFRQLRRYLSRHVEKSKESGEVPPIELPGDDSSTSSDVDATDFDEISNTVATMHLQTGALFTDSRLDSVITKLEDLKIQNEETPKMSIEALLSSVVPFDVRTTAEAVWQHHLTKAYRVVESDCDTVDISDSRIRRTFRSAMDNNWTTMHARGRIETRRYIEKDRVVIVQSSVIDQINLASVPLPSFAIRHFQWTVIEPPRNALLRQSGKPLSQVETYGVHMPAISELPGSEVRDMVKNNCVQAVSLHLEFERQSVENILLEKLVQGGNVDRTMLHIPQW